MTLDAMNRNTDKLVNKEDETSLFSVEKSEPPYHISHFLLKVLAHLMRGNKQ